MRRTHHQRHHLRGFSLLEVVLVMTLVGLIGALFIPVLGSSKPVADLTTARTAATNVVGVVDQVYRTHGTVPDPSCATTLPAIADPCALLAADPTTPVTTGTATTTMASVAATPHQAGWRVAVTVALSDSGDCFTLLRDLPGGTETPLTGTVCTADAALAAADA